MVLRLNKNITGWDPYLGTALFTENIGGWMEQLTSDDWTLDPSVFSYPIFYRPSDYVKGYVAASWEMTDASTYVVHLRQGVRWQNLPPANGREMTADDVVYDYHRKYGGGDGFAKISPYYATVVAWLDLASVTATDKYTVVFKWKTPNPVEITATMQADGNGSDLECPDAVKQWGDLNDWHHSIGSGPFILTDFVSDSSVTMVKNPSYWGYDERYPKNQLPYIDKLTELIIPDAATSLAALRTGKIDDLDQISFSDAQAMKKTNPEILQKAIPLGVAFSVDPRIDMVPFKDVRVRQAMQMAIDLPTLASTYYGGSVTSTNPCALTGIEMTGWGWPYSQWPQDLKNEYTYNPTASKQLLSAAGYPNGFNTNIVVSNDADLNLVQIVQSYFAAVGIHMDIKTLDPASWNTYVLTQHKNDQIAMRNQGNLGLTFDPFRQIARFTTGYSTNYVGAADPVYDAFYTQALAATTQDGVKQVLQKANEYIVRQHWSISLLEPSIYSLYQPWLKGFTGQNNAFSNGASGPSVLLFQYAARFWIDQNMKKSMGH